METDQDIVDDEEMESIPVDSPRAAAPFILAARMSSSPSSIEEASKQDFAVWEDVYKKLMASSINQFHLLLRDSDWNMVLPQTATENFRLFESGAQRVKVTGILQARGERVFWAIKDQDPETRMQWDGEHMKTMSELQTFKTKEGDIKVIKL